MNTSNKRLAAGMSILLMAALACTAPIIGEDTPEPDDPYQPSAPSNLGNVSVAPTAGSGQFSVSVSYFWRLGDFLIQSPVRILMPRGTTPRAFYP